MPDANTLTFGVMASVAQRQAERISTRIREALGKTTKPLGTRRPGHLDKINWRKGYRNGLKKAREAAAAERRADCYADLGIDAMRKDGLSFAAIAERLNLRGFTTTSGKPFAAMTVYRIAQRASA
jgi:DNA invertase Pin-like site-specific DNA recombinase